MYLGCICVAAGWWYWLEANDRRTTRSCSAAVAGAAERSRVLSEAVARAETRWAEDVRGKEAMLVKVQHANVSLARTLDDMSNYLKQCQRFCASP